MLQGMGAAYAISTGVSEWHFARGMDETRKSISFRVGQLREAARLDPFDWRKRNASANLLGIIAIKSADPAWQNAALPELRLALQTDYTSADMLFKVIAIDMAKENYAEAQQYYNQFKRVARASPLIQLVAQSHQQGRPAVTAIP